MTEEHWRRTIGPDTVVIVAVDEITTNPRKGFLCTDQVGQYLWIGGTLLIVGSWTGAVSPTVGWSGFVFAAVGSLMSYSSSGVDKSSYPLTQEGFAERAAGLGAVAEGTVQVATERSFLVPHPLRCLRRS